MDELTARRAGLNTAPLLNVDPRVFDNEPDEVLEREGGGSYSGWNTFSYVVWREIDETGRVLHQWATAKGKK